MVSSHHGWVPGIEDVEWIDSIAAAPHPVLLEMEQVARPEGIPILDRHSGRALAVLASHRTRIVEIGTAIGYSTLWMALAQPVGGTIVTIDPDDTRTARARAFWQAAGVADGSIVVVNQPALTALAADDPALAGPFDLAFIDALKDEYEGYLDALLPRMAPGGVIVADNVLWSGRTSGSKPSRLGDGTAELRAFCKRVLADPQFAATILPLGDGLLVAAMRDRA
jgi:predicted O-methyltransferase YrrM